MPAAPPPSVKDIVRETRAVYADLAGRPADRNCTGLAECCQFKLTGRTPHLTRGEALTAWTALKASGRKTLPEGLPGACPMLNPKTLRCLIYEGRPFGCRTHFCEPAGGMMDRRQVIDLIRRLEAIDAAAGGDGARPIAGALKAVEGTR
jgi:Fe-S-cluster containining protein